MSALAGSGSPLAGRIEPRRIAYALLALVLLVAFAWGGPFSPLGVAAAAGSGLWILSGLRNLRIRPSAAIPFLVPLIFQRQIAPALWVFDGVAVLLCAAAITALWRSHQRADWELHTPQWFALAFLLVPFLALPAVVVSPVSFAAGIRVLLTEAGVFFALCYLVKQRDASSLLWAFPTAGAFVTGQLMWKMRGLDIRQLSRLDMRNLYSSLGWGESNYIAAVLTVCILGTFLCILVERRRPVRLGLIVLDLWMLVESIRLYSRGATIALAVGGLVLIANLGRARALLVLVSTALGGTLLFATPFGKVFLERFSNPEQYASWAIRVQVWQIMWARFLGHPWTGTGLNQSRYQIDMAAGAFAHNVVLDYLSEQGICGGILIVVLFIALLRLARHVEAPGADQRVLRAGATALVVASLVNSLVEPTFAGYEYAMLFLFAMAWLRLAGGRTASPSA